MKSKLKLLSVLVVILGLMIAGLYFITRNSNSDAESSEANKTIQPAITASNDTTSNPSYKKLNGDEYKNLFLDSSHPNTKMISQPPVITGNAVLDMKIQTLAEAGGYRLQKVPKTPLEDYGGVLLQYKLAEAWDQLVTKATEAGIELRIESGMRSIDDQREIFLQRLGSSTTDAQIDQVLSMTAPPGYSRHHSGYVIDIADTSATVFEYSEGYKWISADDFLVAKQVGIIPSYPNGAKDQGPEPEVWEYVWVGHQLLIE